MFYKLSVDLDIGKYLYNLVVFKILDTVNKASNKNTILIFLCKLNLSPPLVIGQPEICRLQLIQNSVGKTLSNYKLNSRNVFSCFQMIY
jgi:hypothetical protein